MNSLFDIQINGFAGIDFQATELDIDEMHQAVDGLARHQTLRFFPTLITDSLDSLERKFARFESFRCQDKKLGEVMCGYHLEGPWLSAESGYRGAHDARWMGSPDLESFHRLQEAAGGNIRLVTLAPELPGSEAFIKELIRSGVEISLGHTAASEDDISRAIGVGVRFCTHLGNGVPTDLHRHENVIQRLLARDELYAFFIPDGIHLPPAVLKNLVRAKPDKKALFTTDAMSAAGAPPGQYPLGDLTMEVGEDRVVRMPGAENFAGSALAPDQGVSHLEKWLGWTTEKARASFSTNIAALFRIDLPKI